MTKAFMMRVLFEMAARRTTASGFTESQWRELLAFADRTQLTLYLRGTPGLPPWLAEEIEIRRAKNVSRRLRLRAAYAEAADALSEAGVEFVLLKGFTHETGFGLESSASKEPCRVQYDLDLLTKPASLSHARAVLGKLGYAPHGAQSLSEEHARPLVRLSEWSWRGDYYDPDMPIPIELHASAWSAERDKIAPTGIEGFWDRRCTILVNGLEIPAFAEVDRLAFAALHALRHILRHDAKPAHVLELARFLDACGCDSPFWDRWRALHSPELRALQAVAFRFAQEWFGCRSAAPPVHSKSVETWFRDFAWSPIANLDAPNKDTVWLHLALIANPLDRVRVFCDRILPVRMPHEAFLGRLRYHAGALAPVLVSGLRWRLQRDAASTASEISDWKRHSV